jgi:hypothetical protein
MTTPPPSSEAYVQSEIRLEAARLGVRLYRNNNGALKDEFGRLVRFGLGNESEALNRKFKSSDLIGWRPLLITPSMVGQTVAVFVAREVKHRHWTYCGSEHEAAQRAFIDLVVADGGDACFATGEGTFV